MSLNSKVFSAHKEYPGKIKHLFLRPVSPGQEQEYAPSLYIEARIDFSDVRSGFHETLGMNSILDMLPFEGDMRWSRDMVRTADPALLQTSQPEEARLRSLPDFVTAEYLARVEGLYLAYLLQNAHVQVFRNFCLNNYSLPGESREEFQQRCLDLLNESFRSDLDAMREVVNRRLARIEQKYVSSDRSAGLDSDRRTIQARSRLHAVAEQVAELFLQTELTAGKCELDLHYPDLALPELEQRLQTLEMEVLQEIQRLLNSYQEKVLNIDDYIIHPNHRDLHLVRTCILWMPVGALA